MIEMYCVRCNEVFADDRTRGYCDACVDAYRGRREQVDAKREPEPGVLVDGVFCKSLECPVTVYAEERDNEQVCGLCGSNEIDAGYGIGTGYGCGSYMYCHDCQSFLDFNEDTGE